MNTTQNITREQWLQHAVDEVRSAYPSVGIPAVQVSCSWPGGGSAKKRIGECWPRKASKADVNELFISPKIEESNKVLGILMHELAHAVDDCKSGHRAGFVKIAKALSCEGKPTSMVPANFITEPLVAILTRKHGAYPHRTLDKAQSPVKKQTVRMIKCECDDCGVVWRMSATAINMAQGALSCPCCKAEEVTVG